jgi:hypothetical protein
MNNLKIKAVKISEKEITHTINVKTSIWQLLSRAKIDSPGKTLQTLAEEAIEQKFGNYIPVRPK